MTRSQLHAERKRAEQLVAEQRYTEAAEIYRAVLAEDDSHARTWYGMGYCFYKLGNLDQSRLSLREAYRRGYGPADVMLRRIRDRIAADAGAPALVAASPVVTPRPASGLREMRGGKQPAAPETRNEAEAVQAQSVRRLLAHKEALRAQLDDLCLSLALKAEVLRATAAWPQTIALRQARAALEKAERDLEERGKLLRQAREKYHKKKAGHRERLAQFKETLAPFEAAVQAAQAKNVAIQAEITAAHEGIRAALQAGTGIADRKDSPVARFEEARAGAAQSLAKAERELEEALAARAEHALALQTEEHAWRKERGRLKQNIQEVETGCLHAEKTAEAARAAYRDALRNLGRAALMAPDQLPQLAERCAEGEHLLRAIAEAGGKLDRKRDRPERKSSAGGH